MNEQEVINRINSLREKIFEAIKRNEHDVLVSLLDKDGNVLTSGRYGIGSDEYGDFIYFSKELTAEDFDYLTVGHIKKWLAAESFSLYRFQK